MATIGNGTVLAQPVQQQHVFFDQEEVLELRQTMSNQLNQINQLGARLLGIMNTLTVSQNNGGDFIVADFTSRRASAPIRMEQNQLIIELELMIHVAGIASALQGQP